jgi:hypothetical protein
MPHGRHRCPLNLLAASITMRLFALERRLSKITPWTQEAANAGFSEGQLVEFPESMCPPGESRLWRVAAVGGPTAGDDGYKWEAPRLQVATH